MVRDDTKVSFTIQLFGRFLLVYYLKPGFKGFASVAPLRKFDIHEQTPLPPWQILILERSTNFIAIVSIC
jgi:hypothetical protein